jgi:hypothetical protein
LLPLQIDTLIKEILSIKPPTIFDHITEKNNVSEDCPVYSNGEVFKPR